LARWTKNQPIRNKSRLWRPCLLTDRDEMSNLYRGPSIDASYQFSVHFAKRFQRRFLTRGSVGWACIAHLTIEWYWSKFQREIIITLKKQQPSWMEGGAVGHNFERNTPRDHLCQVCTLHRCFLSSLAPFGQTVSEEKIFLTLANQKKDWINLGGHVCWLNGT
jgi:hypothetical protein